MAVPPLEALVRAGHDVALVVSQPDRRRGRGSATAPSPVRAAALGLGLPTSDHVADVVGAGAELGVVVAFGRLIRPEVLAAIPMVNLHFSLLPRWRGAAPVERALLAGDSQTGVTLMAIDEGLDTGPVYDRRVVAVRERETADELRSDLVDAGVQMLLCRLAEGARSLGEATPQVGDASYAEKIGRGDLYLDWPRSSEELDRVVRVGPAWTAARGQRLTVLRARPDRSASQDRAARVDPGTISIEHGPERVLVTCGKGRLELIEVRAEGRRSAAAVDWWRGARLGDGTVLGI